MDYRHADKRKELARLLAEMPYNVMYGIAKELVEMNQEVDCNRHPETIVGMAETLADWGEAWADDDSPSS
jgi:hypothetical protein